MLVRSWRAERDTESVQMARSSAHRTRAELPNTASEGRAEVRGPCPALPMTSAVGNTGRLDTRSSGPLGWSWEVELGEARVGTSEGQAKESPQLPAQHPHPPLDLWAVFLLDWHRGSDRPWLPASERAGLAVHERPRGLS